MKSKKHIKELMNAEHLKIVIPMAIFTIVAIGIIFAATIIDLKLSAAENKLAAESKLTAENNGQHITFAAEQGSLWDIVYTDTRGSILHFKPNNTMFLDARKAVYGGGVGNITQIFNEDGKPMTYDDWKSQTANFLN